MKSRPWSLCVALLLVVLLLVGCSNPPSPTPEKPSSTPSVTTSEPTVSPSAERQPTQTAATPPASTLNEKPETRPAAGLRVSQPNPVPVREPTGPPQVPVQPETKVPPPIADVAPLAPLNKVRLVILPAGMLIPVRTIDSVDSRTDRVGRSFRASLDSEIVIDDGIVVQKGADASLKLVRVSSAGEISGKSELQLQLERIVVDSNSYVVVSNVIERSASAEGPKTARDIGIGAAIGAAIGAIAGGKKGAAIGAGVGAGSGAAVAAITKGEQVLVPSETRLEFRLQQPVKIAVAIRPNT